jgi:hypothetical protein
LCTADCTDTADLVQTTKKQSNLGTIMAITRRVLLTAVPISLLFAASAPQAASKNAWNGTWVGSWGGQADTSVMIVGNKVVRYMYRGRSVPVGANKVTQMTVTFGTDYTVTITKLTDTTASAQYHSSNGDAAADLTKQ